MSELGQLLQSARKEKGLSLDDVQDTTKIRKRYLEAIEVGNYKDLPGTFYVRAFIKSYAEAVGLDPDEVLVLYKNVIPAVETEVHNEPMIRKRGRSEADTERFGKWTSAVLVVCFFLLILGLIYYFFISNYNGNDTSSENTNITDEVKEPDVEDTPSTVDNSTPSPDVAEEVTPTPVPTPLPTPTPTPTSSVVFDKKVGKTDNYNVSGAETLEVVLTALPDKTCWFEVREVNSSGKLVGMATLNTGDLGNTITYTVSNNVFIRVGNAANVDIMVNGTLVDDGNAAGPKSLQINKIVTDVAPDNASIGN